MLLAVENLVAERAVERRPYVFDRTEGARRVEPKGCAAADVLRRLWEAREAIAATRPTAVSLFWALDRITAAAERPGSDAGSICAAVATEAFAIHAEELEIEFAIGRNGAPFIADGMNVLTHCNAGGLATAGYGTALGVLYAAWEAGRRFHVYADETRPLLQGARLTAWELSKRAIPHTLLCESAAASLFQAGKVDAVIVGADRIASNGDTANKVGTLSLAILCERFGKPFYVAAPWSTFDLGAASGRDIPIEERLSAEVVCFGGARTAPDGTVAYNPAFDITPASLITAIITDRGVLENPDGSKIAALAAGSFPHRP
jgi:methylthioribose-1-phosphate isomerase